MTDRETWLQSIRSNPSDWQAMLVFADWLEEEEGDLLAAEQWRWIAVVDATNETLEVFADWPRTIVPDYLYKHELRFAKEHNIRCMPHYPQTIEDVQAYFSQAECSKTLAKT